MNHSSPSAGQYLCRSCGLCCDGSLFFFTPMRDCEKEDKAQGSIPSRKEETIPQPCVHHGVEHGCSIYATRPNVCRKFKCQLLRDVEENMSTLEEAMRVVEQLNVLRTRLLATVKTHVDDVQTEPLFIYFDRFHTLKRYNHSDHFREHAEWYLDCIAFIQLVRKRLLSDFMKVDGDAESQHTA